MHIGTIVGRFKIVGHMGVPGNADIARKGEFVVYEVDENGKEIGFAKHMSKKELENQANKQV